MKNKFIFLSIIPIIIDQITKIIVSINIKELIIIPNILKINYVTNNGAALSILSNHTIFLIIISILALLLIYNYMKHFILNKRNKLAFILLYGGIISNLFDRIIHGYVIDYIDTIFNFPIFNLADTFIVIGIILIIIAMIKKEDNI